MANTLRKYLLKKNENKIRSNKLSTELAVHPTPNFEELAPANSSIISSPNDKCVRSCDMAPTSSISIRCGEFVVDLKDDVSEQLLSKVFSYDFIEEYIENDEHRSHKSDARYTHSIGDILMFMANKKLCSRGIGWYPYFRLREKILHMKNLKEHQILCIESIRSESLDFPVEELAELIPDFMERFQTFGYSNSPCISAKYVLYNFLVFLEMHELGYHPDIAAVWLERQKALDYILIFQESYRVVN